MKKITSLNDLLFEQAISDHINLLCVIDEFRFLIDRANDPMLKSLLLKHYDSVRLQEQKVHHIFQQFHKHHSEKAEIREMISNVFRRIGRTEDPMIIDAIIVNGVKQITGYMMVNLNLSKELSWGLEHMNLNEYISECLSEETRFRNRLESYEVQWSAKRSEINPGQHADQARFRYQVNTQNVQLRL
jgi:hypothetical protein